MIEALLTLLMIFCYGWIIFNKEDGLFPFLIEDGVLDSEYTQQELSQLCNKMEFDIFWGCITGGVW